MAEITSSAYQDIRNHIQSTWKYIELQDETGNKIIRLSPSDNRVISIIEGNNVKITLVVKGSDEDALNALMLHPLCGDFAQAKSCYEEMKAAHKAYLPQFFKGE